MANQNGFGFFKNIVERANTKLNSEKAKLCKCGKQNEIDSRFCKECGRELK